MWTSIMNSQENLRPLLVFTIPRLIYLRNKALKMGLIPYAALYDRELDELNVIEGLQP